MTSPFQGGFSQLLLQWLLTLSRAQSALHSGWLQLSVLQASQAVQPQLLLEQGGGKVPLVGLARSWREAWNLSAASLRCCPSPALVQDFRAFSPLSQPSSVPCVTLETAPGDWWPEGEWWAGKAVGREQAA